MTNTAFKRIRAAKMNAAPEDQDLEHDHGLEQPGVTIQPHQNGGGSGAGSNAFAATASARIRTVRAMCEGGEDGYMVEGDAFEGWINTLQYQYQRPEGEDFAIVDADPGEVQRQLKDDGWIGTEKGLFSKGDHEVQLAAAGQGKTKITSIK